MTVPFNAIPASVRVPLFYAEMDNSRANVAGAENLRSLLIGQKLAAGSATANTPIIVGSEAQAIALFGRGSMLHRMFLRYRQSDPMGEVWAVPLLENASGVAATGTIAVTGPATSAGTITLYIADQKVQMSVASSDTATAIGTAIAAAINAAADLPVTATAATGTVTLTCRWKGLTGNDIRIEPHYAGLAAGESTPAGVGLTVTAMAAGTTAPSLATAILAMGDEPFDFIASPYTDSTSLAALSVEMGDSAGRWSYARQTYGHVYSARRGDLNSLVTFGGTVNDQHLTVAAIDADTLAPSWEIAAAFAARTAVFIKADPARPTQTGELTGVTPPRVGKRFLKSERESLLNYGMATCYVDGGALRIERAVTTYQVNASGQDDVSYLDAETLHTSAYVLRFLRSAITSKYARHKLANDGTRFAAGASIVTPAVIRGELIGAYLDLEHRGIVENASAFSQHLIVERAASDPNRLDVLFPPDYVNQLRVFAVLNQFRLNY